MGRPDVEGRVVRIVSCWLARSVGWGDRGVRKNFVVNNSNVKMMKGGGIGRGCAKLSSQMEMTRRMKRSVRCCWFVVIIARRAV